MMTTVLQSICCYAAETDSGKRSKQQHELTTHCSTQHASAQQPHSILTPTQFCSLLLSWQRPPPAATERALPTALVVLFEWLCIVAHSGVWDC